MEKPFKVGNRVKVTRPENVHKHLKNEIGEVVTVALTSQFGPYDVKFSDGRIEYFFFHEELSRA